MYWFRKDKPSMSKKMRDILILALTFALLLDVVLAVLLFAISTSDTKLSDTLVSMTQTNVESLRNAATQISRTGSSYTTQLLGESKQYLFGLQQINELAQELLGHELIASQPLSDALSALDACQARTLAGQALDEPLAALWEGINQLEEIVAQLTRA